jgi:hypothetical protein
MNFLVHAVPVISPASCNTPSAGLRISSVTVQSLFTVYVPVKSAELPQAVRIRNEEMTRTS